MGQYDAQFYLKIAGEGYDSHPLSVTGQQTYAFSPLFPISIAAFHIVIPSLELSAFIVSEVALLSCFIVLYWAVTRWHSFELATKTAWLLFLFPFSIFYRGYYSEGIFLLLLLLFMDALRSKKWVVAIITSGLMVVTRFVGLSAVFILAWALLREWRAGKTSLRKVVSYCSIALVPLGFFMLYCLLKTGDPLYFIKVRALWHVAVSPPFATLHSYLHFWSQRWLRFHSSKIDMIAIVVTGLLIYKSRNWLPRLWWYVSLLLWLIPILTTDTMSATRYQMVNVPLFMYVAYILPKHAYRLVVLIGAGGLFYVSIYFINWYWLG